MAEIRNGLQLLTLNLTKDQGYLRQQSVSCVGEMMSVDND